MTAHSRIGVRDLLPLGRLYATGLYLAVMVRVRPLRRVLDRVGRTDRLGIPADCCGSPETAARLVERLFGPATLPFTGRCLVKSLLLFALLHPLVPGVRLVLGLRAEGRHPFSVTGHAWVSVNGRPILPRDHAASSRFRSVVVLAGSDGRQGGPAPRGRAA